MAEEKHTVSRRGNKRHGHGSEAKGRAGLSRRRFLGMGADTGIAVMALGLAACIRSTTVPTSTVLSPSAASSVQAATTPGAPDGTVTEVPSRAPTAVSDPTSIVEDQAGLGQAVFLRRAARCHGQRGEGAAAPAVIGPKAPLTAYATTAQELFDYIRANMPLDAPGTLKEDEYWAVLAFILKENGLYDGPTPLGPDVAPSILLKR